MRLRTLPSARSKDAESAAPHGPTVEVCAADEGDAGTDIAPQFNVERG